VLREPLTLLLILARELRKQRKRIFRILLAKYLGKVLTNEQSIHIETKTQSREKVKNKKQSSQTVKQRKNSR
jgi:hypothetical protein